VVKSDVSGSVDRAGADATSRAWYEGRLDVEARGTDAGKFMARCSRKGFGHEPCDVSGAEDRRRRDSPVQSDGQRHPIL
jgi:hypothetical protein